MTKVTRKVSLRDVRCGKHRHAPPPPTAAAAVDAAAASGITFKAMDWPSLRGDVEKMDNWDWVIRPIKMNRFMYVLPELRSAFCVIVQYIRLDDEWYRSCRVASNFYFDGAGYFSSLTFLPWLVRLCGCYQILQVDALRGVGVRQIACGSGHTVVLTTDGEGTVEE